MNLKHKDTKKEPITFTSKMRYKCNHTAIQINFVLPSLRFDLE